MPFVNGKLDAWPSGTLPSGGTIPAPATTPTTAAIPTLSPTSEPTPDATDAPNQEYDLNLQRIKSSSVRNRNHDNSPFAETVMAEIPIEQLYGPRSVYLGNPGGNPENSFPVEEGGQFRTSCEFSHFAYDDPILYPNQPGVSHLHMFWGNTDVNAYSTYDTLIDSGSSTCNGQELNRTGYWAPAIFDGDGHVRIPERIVVYYKGYGLANGNAETYPAGAAMVVDDKIHRTPWDSGGTAGPGTGEASFMCSNQWRGNRVNLSSVIPFCDGSSEGGFPRTTLEMHIKFPNCWNGEDPSNPDNWLLAAEGGWFYSFCNELATFPNIEYIIVYPLDVGETTDGWFLASDVNPITFERGGQAGSTVHADWWGGWNPAVNEMWIDNCVNYSTDQPSGCGMGYLTDGGPDGENPDDGPALKFRPQYDGPIKAPASTLFEELCATGRTINSTEEAAYCNP